MGNRRRARRRLSYAWRAYVQVGVLVCPFVLGDGVKLPVQLNSVMPPWLIVSA
jgi:hypothetical protein